MNRILEKIIPTIFYIFLLMIPLIFYSKTSELFEFNKMMAVYIVTIIISVLWIVKMIIHKKFIYTPSPLQIPLIIFLISQIISTIFSISPHTSMYGYYSRFNGGLLSILSYIILYFAFVSNMSRNQTIVAIKFLVASSIITSIWGSLEHFGYSPSCYLITGNIKATCWVQDVQLRVFATLGQPNWLATFLIGIIPLIWYFYLTDQKKKWHIKWVFIYILTFATLLFTKSRSGLLGLILSSAIFIAGYYLINKKTKISSLVTIVLATLSVGLIFGTPWTKTLFELTKPTQNVVVKAPEKNIIEEGGTESGEIRKIVWEGALNLWKKYPLIGTGVETFAYSYYETRPKEHNLVSEWDFLYNKAHNEYLNLAANTGSFGLISYLLIYIVLGYKVLIKLKNAKVDKVEKLFALSILTAVSGISISHFFGFSVVLTNLLMFILPAFLFANTKLTKSKNNIDGKKLALISIVFLIGFIFLSKTVRFWIADYNFAYGKSLNNSGDPVNAVIALSNAIEIFPNEPTYHDEISQSYISLLFALPTDTDDKTTNEILDKAVEHTEKALKLNPRNMNIRRGSANNFVELSKNNKIYLLRAVQILEDSIKLAPSDPKVMYHLGVNYLRMGENEEGLKRLDEAINLKPNYKDPRITKAIILIEQKKTKEAKSELQYILDRIDPKDTNVKESLDKLK